MPETAEEGSALSKSDRKWLNEMFEEILEEEEDQIDLLKSIRTATWIVAGFIIISVLVALFHL